MKKMLVVLAAALFACGGKDSSVDPTKTTFTYPAGHAPATSNETSAVSAGQTQLVGASGVGTADAATARDGIVSLADSVSFAGFGDSGLSGAVAGAPAQLHASGVAQSVVGHGMAALRGDEPASAMNWATCATVETGRITYDCHDTVTTTSGTITTNVTGTITRSVAGGTATYAWDLHVNVDTTGTIASGSGHDHATGSVAVTATTVVGSARSDWDVSTSVGAMSESFSFSHLADVNVVYDSGSSCVTSGTLEVRRVWTKQPAYAGGYDTHNYGLEITWTAPTSGTCGTVSVASGTENP